MLKEASGTPAGRSPWAAVLDLAARLDLQLLHTRAEAARQPEAAQAAALVTASHLHSQRARSQGTKRQLLRVLAAVAAERQLALTAQLSIRRCRHGVASQELVRADVESVHRCAAQEEDETARRPDEAARSDHHPCTDALHRRKTRHLQWLSTWQQRQAGRRQRARARANFDLLGE